MDVIGNNIANVNTYGFKKGRVSFKETFSQTMQGASAPQNGRGGTNPQQMGLGVSIGAIDTIHDKGAPERTGLATDLMINGDGFFIVSDDANFLNRSYTRAGNFKIDEGGNLVTADGYRVLGNRVESIGEDPKYKSELEGLVISKAMTFPAKVTGSSGTFTAAPSKTRDVSIEGNINADQGTKATITAKDTDGTAGLSNTTASAGDTFSVPASKLTAGSTTVTVYDALGGAHQVKLTFRRKFKTDFEYDWANEKFTKTNFADPTNSYGIGEAIEPNKWEIAFELVGGGELDIDQTGKAVVDATFTNGKIDLGKVNIEIKAGTTAGAKFPNGAETFNFNLDFKDKNGNAGLTQFSDDTSITAHKLTGYKQGNLDSYTIGKDGVITGSFTNGMHCEIGRLALAKFKNPAGLLKSSNNLFINSPNSGEPIIGKPGASGFSDLTPGSLEMSNVDLAQEFTQMITTQRGFQANSKVITTTDEMLQELVNLKR
jgi:flagellar hook protein FlgE